MSRQAKHRDLTPEFSADVLKVMQDFRGWALGEMAVSDDDLSETIEPLLQLCEFGHDRELVHQDCADTLTLHEMAQTQTGPVSDYRYFKPSIDKARKSGDRQELARWALALLVIRQAELHVPRYAAKLSAEMERGKQSALNRDTKNARDLIEAWERENHVMLSSTSPPTQIRACAASCDREPSTIVKALQERQKNR